MSYSKCIFEIHSLAHLLSKFEFDQPQNLKWDIHSNFKRQKKKGQKLKRIQTKKHSTITDLLESNAQSHRFFSLFKLFNVSFVLDIKKLLHTCINRYAYKLSICDMEEKLKPKATIFWPFSKLTFKNFSYQITENEIRSNLFRDG